MKKYILILIAFIVFVSGFALYPKKEKLADVVISKSVVDPYKHIEVSLNGNMFDGLVSDTEILHEKGLSGFTGLDDNQLMLFVFEYSDMTGFWMKDMLFSLDIVWLDADMKIVSIEKNVSPETFPKVFFPSKPAQYVLELTAGVVDRVGIKINDIISIPGGK